MEGREHTFYSSSVEADRRDGLDGAVRRTSSAPGLLDGPMRPLIEPFVANGPRRAPARDRM
jgi:hypothetical protein